jgi:ribosome-binding protein aMBF1 (putative translation factor)
MNGNDETKTNRASMLLLAKEGASNFRILSMVTKNIFSGHIGSNVRQIRIDKNISIEELANLSDMTYSQVSRIELGKINTTCYTLYVLSKVLGVHMTDFFRDNIE